MPEDVEYSISATAPFFTSKKEIFVSLKSITDLNFLLIDGVIIDLNSSNDFAIVVPLGDSNFSKGSEISFDLLQEIRNKLVTLVSGC